MIVEIALGIVLAVLILAYLGMILRIALWAIGVAIAIVLIALAVYVFKTYPDYIVWVVWGAMLIYTIFYILAQREEDKRAKAEQKHKANSETQN